MASVVKAGYWFPDGAPEFSADQIDSTLFTHLICAFANIDPNTYKVSVSSNHEKKFSTFTDIVKRSNPQVQTLLSIGGKNTENSVFASMASNPTSRKSFIDSSIDIAKKDGFNGFDLAWEYPSNDVEMSNFKILLQEWKKAVEAQPLLLTARVYYSSDYHSTSYQPIKSIVDNLDWVNVIAFDFCQPDSSTETSPYAALFSRPSRNDTNGKTGLENWTAAGLPTKQVVFGLPYVGWAWQLKDARDHGYDAPSIGPAISPDGSINFVEVREFITDNKITPVHDNTVIEDYCQAGKTWIGYDGNQSIVTKVKYVKQKIRLLGYFAWHVGADYNSELSSAAFQAWDATESTTGE